MAASPLHLMPDPPQDRDHEPVLGQLCPDVLSREIKAGGVIMFVGASSKDGPAGIREAVQNVESAVRWAAEWAGVDCQHLLPGTDELIRMFTVDGVPLLTGRDLKTGKPLKTRRLLRRLAPNVLIHLSTGSRRKLDDRTRSNAISDDIGESIFANTVCLLCVHEGTRLLRLPTAVAPIANSLWGLVQSARVHPWMYFGDHRPPAPWSEEVEQELWNVGKAGKREVELFEHRGASGVIAQTGPRLVDGQVRYGIGRPGPPGSDTAKIRPADRRDKAQSVLYLDEPESRPNPTEVRAGRLAERAIRGEPVTNQVKLVRWFLRHFGLPRWGYDECADYLVGHGFRTPGLYARGTDPENGYRRYSDSGKSLARNICRTILDRLDWYFTEQIVVRGINVDGSDHVIQGFRPARGPWMTKTDYDRIHKYLDAGRARPRHTAGYAFTGWLVGTPLGPGRLAAHEGRDGRIRYYVLELHSHRHLGTRGCRLPAINHEVLAGAFVDGLIKHHGALGPLIASIETTEEVDEAHLTALRHQIAKQRTQQKGFQGKWKLLDGPALTDAKLEFNALVASREANEGELRVLEARGRAADGPVLHGVPLSGLLRFVTGLRDAADVAYRDAFLDGASVLDLQAVDPAASGVPAGAWRWSATAAFHDEHDTWVVPMEATTAAPRPGRKPNPCPDWLRSWVDQLRAGVLFRDLPGSADRSRLAPLRHALGITPGAHFRFAGERDPRLLRLQMAIVHPAPARVGRRGAADARSQDTAVDPTVDPPTDPTFGLLGGPPLTRHQLPALAKRLGEPPELLRAIHDVYVTQPAPKRPSSLRPRNEPQATAYVLAARTGRVTKTRMSPEDYELARRSLRTGPFAEDWDLEPDAMRLRPCPHCGHHGRARLRPLVVTGGVCTRCRKDRRGVPWEAVPYDRYRDRPPRA